MWGVHHETDSNNLREGWHTWIDVSRLYKGSKPKFNASDPRGSALSPGKHLPHAFHGSPWRDNTILSEKLDFCPMPQAEALKLWDFFMERVEHIVKISFSWTLTHLRAALSDAEKWRRLDNGDHVLILSTCLFGATSLTNQECLNIFGRTKSSVTNECRVQCDMAFSRISLLAIDSISTLKAMCLYIVSYLPRTRLPRTNMLLESKRRRLDFAQHVDFDGSHLPKRRTTRHAPRRHSTRSFTD